MTQMANREIPPTPENFELWYAYVAGEDADLKRTIDGLIANGCKFDTNALAILYTRYFRDDKNEEIAADVSERVSSELDSVLRMLDVAGKDHSAYGRALSQASGELGGGKLAETDIKKVIDQVIGATRAMETRSKVLEQKLQQSSREVGELRERLESVRKESLTDQLTGIANRKAFDNEFLAGIERAMEAQEPMCLIMCDIDHFKKFNDTWGHNTGDQVLKLVANCLAENVKGRDTAARYGGEEFAVVLPQTDIEDAFKLADQIRQKVESKKLVKKSTGDILGTITISCGVALLRPGETPETFLQRADACLYSAKHAGRNRVMAETPAQSSTAAA